MASIGATTGRAQDERASASAPARAIRYIGILHAWEPPGGGGNRLSYGRMGLGNVPEKAVPAQDRARGQIPAPRGMHSRSEEHTSELQSLMRISYAVFCLNKKK